MGVGISSCVISDDHHEWVVPAAELARALDADDHVAVLTCLRERPQLMSQKCLPSGNTVWHHLARSGDVQLLTALFALVEQTHDPRNQHWLAALAQQHQQHQRHFNLGAWLRQRSSPQEASALVLSPRLSSDIESPARTRTTAAPFLTPRGTLQRADPAASAAAVTAAAGGSGGGDGSDSGRGRGSRGDDQTAAVLEDDTALVVDRTLSETSAVGGRRTAGGENGGGGDADAAVRVAASPEERGSSSGGGGAGTRANVAAGGSGGGRSIAPPTVAAAAALASLLADDASGFRSPDALSSSSSRRRHTTAGTAATSFSASAAATASVSTPSHTPGSPFAVAVTPIAAAAAASPSASLWYHVPPPRQASLLRALSRYSFVQPPAPREGVSATGDGLNRSDPHPIPDSNPDSSGGETRGESYSTAVNGRLRWLSWRRLSRNGTGVGTGGTGSAVVPGGGGGAAAAAMPLRPGAAALAAMLSSRNSKGQTPLMLACSHGQATMVALLLRKGADPWAIDPHKGLTALHYAAIFGHYMCAKLLLGLLPSSMASSAAFARLPDPVAAAGGGRQWLLEARSRSGAAALHLAADLGHTSVVELLLQYGADLTARVTPTPPLALALLPLPAALLPRRRLPAAGATALHLAARSNDMATALALLRHYYALLQAENPTAADPRVAEDSRGRRPHQIAYTNRSYRMAVVLRPDYPPRWLFGLDSGGSSELEPHRPAEPSGGGGGGGLAAVAAAAGGGRLSPSPVPPLATLASAALRRVLLQELADLEDLATASCTAAVAATAGGGEGPYGGDGCGGGGEDRSSSAPAASLVAAVATAAPFDVALAAALSRVDTGCVAATVTAASVAKASAPASAPVAPAPPAASPGANNDNNAVSGCSDVGSSPPAGADTAAATPGPVSATANTAPVRSRSRQTVTHGSVGLPGAVEAPPSPDRHPEPGSGVVTSDAGDAGGGGLPYIADSDMRLRRLHAGGGGGVVQLTRPASTAPHAAAARCLTYRRPASASASATTTALRRCSSSTATATSSHGGGGAASAPSVRSHAASGGGGGGSFRLFAVGTALPAATTAAAANLSPLAASTLATAMTSLPRELPAAAAAAGRRPRVAKAPVPEPQSPLPRLPSAARQTAWGPSAGDDMAPALALPYRPSAAIVAAEAAPVGPRDEVVPAFINSLRPGAALPYLAVATAPPPLPSSGAAAADGALPAALHLDPDPETHPDAQRRRPRAESIADVIPYNATTQREGVVDGSRGGAAAVTAAAAAAADGCGICLEDSNADGPLALVSLRGCRHRLCVACARRLVDTALPRRPATCPFCRGRIAGFDLSPGGHGGARGAPAAAAAAAMAPAVAAAAAAAPPVVRFGVGAATLAAAAPPPPRPIEPTSPHGPQPLLPGQPMEAPGGGDAGGGGSGLRFSGAVTVAA